MPTKYYTLDNNGEPIPWNSNTISWSTEFHNIPFDKLCVEKTIFTYNNQEIKVSTVFLGMNHNWTSQGGPHIWETMIFGGPLDQYQERCGGPRANAQQMHNTAVELLKKEINQ